MNNVFITGGTGGIGQGIIKELEQRKISYMAPDRETLDLKYPGAAFEINLSGFDTIIHCAGANAGTYRGFIENSAVNQLEQMNVNFLSTVMLAKNVLRTPGVKRFIHIGSNSHKNLKTYKMTYAVSKLASKLVIDTIREEHPDIKWTGIFIGRTRTNMLFSNYEGTRSREDIDKEYDSQPHLEIPEVVEAIFNAIDNDLNYMELTPNDKTG